VRIGLISSPSIPVPPPLGGGAEEAIDKLACGLRNAGHDVELFTVGESRCDVNRAWIFDSAVAPIGDAMYESIHVEAAYRALSHVDVIHDHTTVGPLLGAHRAPPGVPVVTTARGPFTPTARQLYSRLPDRVALIATSHSQRASAPDLDVTAVIPDGIDTGKYVAGPGGGGYLAYVGRMNAEGGARRSVEVARRAGVPLVMMVRMREAIEHTYYETAIKPIIGRDVEMVIEPEERQRIELVGRAEALINPIVRPEPFGLVMAESLACATPVIASPHAAAQEIVEPGRTGYLYHHIEDLVEAVAQIGTIDRSECRSAATQKFSIDHMVEAHVRLYRRLIDQACIPSLIGRAASRSGPRRMHRVAL
jgi:glycosyltransferase involved in cell wall biosynthesis